MPTHLAFLRAVNVGGHGPIPMAKLRAWLEKLGCTDVRTLLQSGNVVFQSEASGGAALERKLEAAAAKDLGLETDFFVRTAKEWDAVIAQNPFPAEAKNDPSHLVVVVLKTAPSAAQVKSLQAATARKGRELVHAHARELYVVYRDGIGRSKLTLGLIEKHLGARGTGRNWNTVLKMAALAIRP
jgi:uncharacterized protein (DUF1697 family)